MSGNAHPPLAVLEVHERSGSLRQRLRLDPQAELRIGRALDNDLILDDPYVCAHHARLHHDPQRGWLLTDSGSVNGLRSRGRRLPEIELSGELPVRLGHTQLLFRVDQTPPPATLVDLSDHRLAQALGSVVVALISALLLAACVGVADFLGQSEHQRWLPAVAEALGVLAMVSVWALAWAIVNRLFAHRLNYSGHLNIGAGGFLLVLLADTLVEYLLFGLAADAWVSPLKQLLVYGGFGAILWAHLGLVAGQISRRQAIPAALVSGMVFVLFSLPELARDDFRSEPDFQVLLKPPAAQWVDGLEPDHFYARAAELAEAVDAELAESAPQRSD